MVECISRKRFYKNRSLIEVSRKDLVLKSRTQSKTRFNKRLNYQVSNFRGVDLQQMFENDYFVFNTPIKDYVCTIAFPGVFTSLKQVVRSTAGDPSRINLQMVIRALRIAFDATDDVKVNCTCADWIYRFAYYATKNGYKYGPPENRPSDITNPDDTLGATCKHLDMLLSNKRWLVKAASVVNAFIKTYPDKAANYLYDTYSAPDVDDREDEVDDVPVTPENDSGSMETDTDDDELLDLEEPEEDTSEEDEEEEESDGETN